LGVIATENINQIHLLFVLTSCLPALVPEMLIACIGSDGTSLRGISINRIVVPLLLWAIVDGHAIDGNHNQKSDQNIQPLDSAAPQQISRSPIWMKVVKNSTVLALEETTTYFPYSMSSPAA
jgi:hypothetical protein